MLTRLLVFTILAPVATILAPFVVMLIFAALALSMLVDAFDDARASFAQWRAHHSPKG
jgi:hypothetical protein